MNEEILRYANGSTKVTNKCCEELKFVRKSKSKYYKLLNYMEEKVGCGRRNIQ